MIKSITVIILIGLAAVSCGEKPAGLQVVEAGAAGEFGLAQIPEAGSYTLKVISPSILEIAHYTTEAVLEKEEAWNFVDAQGNLQLPEAGVFSVRAGGETFSIKRLGFKRYMRHISRETEEVIIGNYLYIELSRFLSENTEVRVTNPEGNILPRDGLTAAMSESRRSPAVHGNQLGYWTAGVKKVYAGYYLGSLGELEIGEDREFALLDVESGKEVFRDKLRFTQDLGWRSDLQVYSKVYEADFSRFDKTGWYLVEIEGLGRSYLFPIGEGLSAAYTRTMALGMYHLRCGTALEMPYTRFTHKACHTDSAEIPDYTYEEVNRYLSGGDNTAAARDIQVLNNIDSCYYPFKKFSRTDISGGHHSGADMGKNTVKSAEILHTLIFAAEVFPGVSALDNLGFLESGNNIGDFWELVKREGDFLVKMQEEDGGFYTMAREIDEALAGGGEQVFDGVQVVYPKNITATAAASAALAQAGSAKTFRRYFPQQAETYLLHALKGWLFLLEALDKYGWRGSYQAVRGCGEEFANDDELIWAAVEVFLAFNDEYAHNIVLENFDPTDKNTMRDRWEKMSDGYGCAIRSYAFAEMTGRAEGRTLNEKLLGKCREQVTLRADELAEWSAGNAYGLSFPFPYKRSMNAADFSPEEAMFDLASAYQLQVKPEYWEAIFGNMDYVLGANPLNVCFLTGTGFMRQWEITDLYAQSDNRHLPPSGWPIECIQNSAKKIAQKGGGLIDISFPAADKKTDAYPLYDRWSDAAGEKSEIDIVKQAKALSAGAFLMAGSSIKEQKYRGLNSKILEKQDNIYEISLEGKDLNLDRAWIVWETEGCLPVMAKSVKWDKSVTLVKEPGLEVEILFPDGRRGFLKYAGRKK